MFSTVNGETGVAKEFIKKLEKKGKTEVSEDRCDFILAFCKISTRPGIDIEETIKQCPGLKLQPPTGSVHVQTKQAPLC